MDFLFLRVIYVFTSTERKPGSFMTTGNLFSLPLADSEPQDSIREEL